jgi:Rps23 Pro-64 3,4-dihydroxylase Tpa1-like proline 4-hydroxylase
MDFVLEIPNNLSPEVCEDIIQRFEKDDRKLRGRTANKDDTLMKHSTDLGLTGLDDWKDIDEILHMKLSEGMQKYAEHLKKVCGVSDVYITEGFDTGYQIQRTDTGGFYSWHHDQDFDARRSVTFIWYLNTFHHTDDGGGTAFHPSMGGKIIDPEQGKLLLFPASWTFLHMGLPLVTDKRKKYICTGWIHTHPMPSKT